MVKWCCRCRVYFRRACTRPMYLPWYVQRQVICALVATGTMVCWMVYFTRYNSFVEAISPTVTAGTKVHSKPPYCFGNNPTDRNYTDVYGNLDDERKHVIFAFWVPLAFSDIVSGLVADMVGPRKVWGIGLLVGLVTALVSFMLDSAFMYNDPVISAIGSGVIGVGLGVFTPCSSAAVAYWVQERRRTLYVAIIESGLFVGFLLVFFLHLMLPRVTWDEWFMLSCVLAFFWLFAWYTLFFNHPSENPNILPEHLEYLKDGITGVQAFIRPREGREPRVPWRSIFRSPPYLSLFLLNLAVSWVHGLVGYHMSKYLSRVLNVTSILVKDLDTTALSLGVALCSVLINGWLSDNLISRGLTSRTSNRRIFLVSTSFVSAVLLVAIPWLECNTTWVVITFYLLIYIQGILYAPLCANVVDLAPRYSGLLRGVLNWGRALSIVLCRHTIVKVVRDQQDYTSWAPIFQLSAVISLIFPIPYMFFGSGEIQGWNYFWLGVPLSTRKTISIVSETPMDVVPNPQQEITD